MITPKIVVLENGKICNTPSMKSKYEMKTEPIILEKIYPRSKKFEKINDVIGKKISPITRNTAHQIKIAEMSLPIIF